MFSRGWLDQASGWAARWVEFVLRHRALAAGGMLLLVVVAGWYSATHLRFNLDTRDMLSPDLSWRRIDLDHSNTFPQYRDTILVVLEGHSRDDVLAAARRVRGRLQARPEWFRSVHYPPASLFFRHNAFLYLDEGELRDLSDQLARAQPFLGPLLRDPSLGGLFHLLEQAAGEGVALNATLDSLGVLEEQVARVLEASRREESWRLPWSTLAGPSPGGGDGLRAILLVKPRLDFGSLAPAQAPVAYLRTLREELSSSSSGSSSGVRMLLTGDAMLAHEEWLSVGRNMGKAVAVASFLVLLILGFGLRSLRMTLAVLLTLAAGLVLTSAFALLTVRELNLISVAFAVLYIGLGVDFAIHYCLYSREQAALPSSRSALIGAARACGGTLLLCTFSTAIGFFAFLPTAFSGVAQLGWIAGCGMFIALALTFSLLPLLLSLGGVVPFTATRHVGQTLGWPERHRRLVCRLAVVLAVGGLAVAVRLDFDPDVLNLNDPSAESVTTFRHLLRVSEESPRSISVIAPDSATARDWQRRLEDLPEVGSTLSLHDFVPDDQEAKLDLVGDLELLLIGALEGVAPGRPAAAMELQALRSYRERACLPAAASPGMGTPATAARQRLCAAVGEFLSWVGRVPQARQAVLLTRLREALFVHLPGLVEDLRLGLLAEPFRLEKLPAELRGRWVSSDGRWLVRAQPAGRLEETARLRAFVQAVRTVAPGVSGPPVAMLEAGDAVAKAFLQALLGALVAVGLLLTLVYRRFLEILCVLLPLGLACLLTLAGTLLLGLSLNFANIIALPLLLGLGIDNGLHLLQRRRAQAAGGAPLWHSASARGIVLSGLTTLAGVGSLALSAHAGTASLGLLLALGVALSALCSLFLVPALSTRLIPVSGKLEK